MKKVSLILLAFFITGCCFMVPCSRYLDVVGQIQNQKGERFQNECELFIIAGGEKMEAPWSEMVSDSFSVSISIAPYGNKYALQLECNGYQPYKTKVFEAKNYSKNHMIWVLLNLNQRVNKSINFAPSAPDSLHYASLCSSCRLLRRYK